MHEDKPQVKRAIDTLYHWFFHKSSFEFPSEPEPTACSTAILSNSGSCGTPGINSSGVLGSFADSLTSKFQTFASNHGHGGFLAGSSIYDKFIEKIKNTNIATAWSEFTSNYDPNLDPFHFQLNRLADKLGVETQSLVAMLLALSVLLLLILFVTQGDKDDLIGEYHHGIGIGREPNQLDIKDSHGNHSPETVNNGTLSSKRSHETQKHTQKNEGDHDNDISRSPTSSFPKRARRPSLVKGDSVISTILEGSSALQREEDDIENDNYEGYEENISDDETADPTSQNDYVKEILNSNLEKLTMSKNLDSEVPGNQDQVESAPVMATNKHHSRQRSDPHKQNKKTLGRIKSYTKDKIESDPQIENSPHATSEEIKMIIEAALAFAERTKIMPSESESESVSKSPGGTEEPLTQVGDDVENTTPGGNSTRRFLSSSLFSFLLGSTISPPPVILSPPSTPIPETIRKVEKHKAVFDGTSGQIPCRHGSLDHNEYVFRNSNGDPVSADDLSEYSDDCDSLSDDDDQGDVTPSILSAAKTSASEVVTLMADISQENLGVTKISFSVVASMVGIA
ncbi:hypothetical protein BGZ76_001024 [Entomortierella beljakovae]|nr:hypothetical protein BGZ76_001024 [Entomortierella beljakovae]